jgi:hypothetical protein
VKSFKQVFTESSLSRLLQHNLSNDCGALTAFRKARNCGEGEPYSYKEKQQRNKSLVAKLLSKGYSVTAIRGKYPEGDNVIYENSFFVVDVEDKGNLEQDLFELGKYFEQDSVLIIPKQSLDSPDEDNRPYLLGTNSCPNNFVGYGKKEYFGSSGYGKEHPFYTTFINGKPFFLEQINYPNTGYGVWGMKIIAEKEWKDIEV